MSPARATLCWANPAESELLAGLSCMTSESRLSCQIKLTEALAGLKVTIAPDE